MQGVRVQSLVRELGSPMLWSQKKKKRTWQYHHNKDFLKSYAVSRSISSTCNCKVWSSCEHSCYLVPNPQTCEGYRLLREFMWIYVPAFATAWLALGSWVQPRRKKETWNMIVRSFSCDLVKQRRLRPMKAHEGLSTTWKAVLTLNQEAPRTRLEFMLLRPGWLLNPQYHITFSFEGSYIC